MNKPNHFLVGLPAKANHPITVLNPDKVFTIKEVKIENNTIFVRGEKTMWFGESLIKIHI